MYGCWHPYKYLATNMCAFIFCLCTSASAAWECEKQVVPGDESHGGNYCWHLEMCTAFLAALRRKWNRLQAVADHGGTAIDRLKSVICKAMVNLLQNWCPLVLYCGFLVRHCNWS